MGDDDLYGRRCCFGDGKEIRLALLSIFNECFILTFSYTHIYIFSYIYIYNFVGAKLKGAQNKK